MATKEEPITLETLERDRAEYRQELAALLRSLQNIRDAVARYGRIRSMRPSERAMAVGELQHRAEAIERIISKHYSVTR